MHNRDDQMEDIRKSYSISFQAISYDTKIRLFEIRLHKDEIGGKDETFHTNDSTWYMQ